MENENKLKLLLITFGTVIGVSLGVIGGYVAKKIILKPPAGSSFENTSDLRRAITEAEEVTDPNKNAPLRALLNPDPSDEIIYVLKPNLNVKFQDAIVKTNSQGFRGNDIQIEKPENTFRIILLGDSFAFGWGVEYEQSFAHLTQEFLNQKTSLKPKIEILNFGVPGYSTFQEVAHYFKEAEKYSPDAVLVYFVDNDFGLPFFIRNFEHPEALLGAREFHRLKDDPQKGNKYKKFLNEMDPNLHLIKLSEACKVKNIPLLVAINPNRKAEKMKEMLWSLKNQADIKLLWLRDELLERVKKDNIDIKTLTLPKDPHPSPKSHRILAEMLSSRIYTEILRN